MRVNVKGFGMIDFPDSMTNGEVRDVLRQFEPKKDDTLQKLLVTLEQSLKQKPQIITEQKIVEVEKQVIVKVPEVRTIEVEKTVMTKADPVSYRFTISRDADGISEIIAEPI